MSKKILKKVSEETMRFMRGKYVADEISDGKDELKFRRGGKTIVSICIRDDRYDFLVIFGKAEREKFEARRGEFPQAIQDIYDSSKTCHDGKWMMIPVADLETLEAVKQMIMIKKKPNRKPLPAAYKLVGRCGNRCDLCVHYKGEISMSAEQMAYARECVNALYGGVPDPDCDGCHFKEHCDNETMQCAETLGLSNCLDCDQYLSCTMHAGWKPEIHTRTITADQVTWAILPYVKGQYGN